MRDKYVYLKKNLCTLLAFIVASGLNVWSNVSFHMVTVWSADWASFPSCTCCRRWALDSVYSFLYLQSKIHNSMQIMSVFCLFPCLLKWKIILISNYEIHYTVSDKNIRKKTQINTHMRTIQIICLLCKWNALIMNKSIFVLEVEI